LTCGMLTDRMARRDPAWQIGVPLLATLICIPSSLAFFLWPPGIAFHIGGMQVPTAFLFYSVFSFFGTWWATPCLGAISHLFAPKYLGQASSIFVMAMTMLGVGFGPLVIGMLSDYLAPSLGGEALRYALAASVSLVLLAALFLAMALPRYRAQLARPGELIAEPASAGATA